MPDKGPERNVEYNKSHPREKAKGTKSAGAPGRDRVVRETKKQLTKNNGK
jgi:hypothetical protein